MTAKIVLNEATAPPVFHFFSPLSTYTSPSRSARVFIDPASDPASFSDSPKAISFSPAAIPGSQRSFCSSVPPTRIGNEPSALTAKPTPIPPQARENSSTTMQRSSTPPPIPPYSSGIQTPDSPASRIAFCTSQGYSCASSYLAATGRITDSASSRARPLNSICRGV